MSDTNIEEMVVNGVTMVPKGSQKEKIIPIQEGTIGAWQIGKSYLLRTVTYHIVGKLIHVDDKELVFDEASWVASSGVWSNALKTGQLSEVEPFEDSVIVGRGALIDATIWKHDLPTKKK